MKMMQAMKMCVSGAMLAFLCVGAGCAMDTDVEEPGTAAIQADDPALADEASVSSTQQAIGNCCSGGGFYCAANPEIAYDYDPPGCGAFTRPKASTLCKNQCGTGCVDSGWQDLCN